MARAARASGGFHFLRRSTKKPVFRLAFFGTGALGRIRTHDPWFVARYSIQLSYERVLEARIIPTFCFL